MREPPESAWRMARAIHKAYGEPGKPTVLHRPEGTFTVEKQHGMIVTSFRVRDGHTGYVEYVYDAAESDPPAGRDGEPSVFVYGEAPADAPPSSGFTGPSSSPVRWEMDFRRGMMKTPHRFLNIPPIILHPSGVRDCAMRFGSAPGDGLGDETRDSQD